MDVFMIIAVGWIIIILLEWTMWQFFKKRIDGIHFPRHVDESHFRFFTPARMRICALLHCAFLLAVLTITFLWL